MKKCKFIKAFQLHSTFTICIFSFKLKNLYVRYFFSFCQNTISKGISFQSHNKNYIILHVNRFWQFSKYFFNMIFCDLYIKCEYRLSWNFITSKCIAFSIQFINSRRKFLISLRKCLEKKVINESQEKWMILSINGTLIDHSLDFYIKNVTIKVTISFYV